MKYSLRPMKRIPVYAMFCRRQEVEGDRMSGRGISSEIAETSLSYSNLTKSSQAFRLRNLSMSSTNENSRKNVDFIQKFNVHPKKNALKRHLEQSDSERVIVQPTQPNGNIAKRMKSDWDLLFYNHENQTYEQCGVGQKKSRNFQDLACQPGDMHPQKKRQSFLVKGKEMKSYFHLLEDEHIQDFLFRDKCMKITDKYLLAMVFAYFKRAGYKIREYTRMNFFVALYLANDMEEDEEELKYEIFPWALGDRWRDRYPRFLLKRDKLWANINHQALVSRCCCDQIMAIEPDHHLWKRNRPEHHAGAVRSYLRGPEDDGYPRGPNSSPRKCEDCDTDSQYDSASPASVTWYVSSHGSTPDKQEEFEFFEKSARKPASSTFDMKGLKKTLTEDGWPTFEE